MRKKEQIEAQLRTVSRSTKLTYKIFLSIKLYNVFYKTNFSMLILQVHVAMNKNVARLKVRSVLKHSTRHEPLQPIYDQLGYYGRSSLYKYLKSYTKFCCLKKLGSPYARNKKPQPPGQEKKWNVKLQYCINERIEFLTKTKFSLIYVVQILSQL